MPIGMPYALLIYTSLKNLGKHILFFDMAFLSDYVRAGTRPHRTRTGLDVTKIITIGAQQIMAQALSLMACFGHRKNYRQPVLMPPSLRFDSAPPAFIETIC